MKKMTVYIGAALLVAGLFALAYAYGAITKSSIEKKQQESLSAASESDLRSPVKVCRVFRMPMVDALWLPGTVQASDDIDLAVQAGGAIEWMGADEGDRVKKGEELLRLDTDVLKAQVARAESAARLAQLRFDRIKQLYESGVEAPDAFDDASSSLESARASLAESKAMLDNATLVSPIDGFLDRRLVDPGEYVQMGQTAMKIVDIDRVEVVCDVPEKDVTFFKKGQTARVRFSNGKRWEFAGTIEFVAKTADRASRTYPVKIVVENEDHKLRPGMICRVELVRRRLDDAIGAPFFTILDREDGKVVYVVGDDDLADERRVTTGFYQGGMVRILDGLDEGDRLVVVGQRELVNDEPVRVAADVTELARAFVASGRDLSQLALEASGHTAGDDVSDAAKEGDGQ